MSRLWVDGDRIKGRVKGTSFKTVNGMRKVATSIYPKEDVYNEKLDRFKTVNGKRNVATPFKTASTQLPYTVEFQNRKR